MVSLIYNSGGPLQNSRSEHFVSGLLQPFNVHVLSNDSTILIMSGSGNSSISSSEKANTSLSHGGSDSRTVKVIITGTDLVMNDTPNTHTHRG